MGAGIEVKVEPYDGTYECLFCGESVRGQPALKCCQCNSNPFHRACDPQSKYAEVCPTCGRKTVEAWKGASAGTAAPSEMIDLTDLEADWGGAGEEAALTWNGAQEEHAVPAVGGSVVGADVGGRVAREGRAEAGSGSSGKGKEPAMADGGPEAGGDGAATGAGAGGDGGGGKGKGRADNGRGRARRGYSSDGESSGGRRGEGRTEFMGA